MKVGFYGFTQSWSNPYLKLFKQHLDRQGVEFVCVPPLSSQNFFEKNPQFNLVDIHWPEYDLARMRLIEKIAAMFFFFINILRLKRMRIGLCWSVHNLEPHETRFQLLDHLSFLLLSSLMDRLVVQTRVQRKALLKKYFLVNPEKIRIVPHGSYVNYYAAPGKTKEEARLQLGLQEKSFVYLFFGLIRKYKGVLDLIKAFQQTRDDHDRLVIVGKPLSDGLAEELQKAADKQIHLCLEYIEDNIVSSYFAAADVCVFPFRKVTNSGSVILAMSFGKPVICPAKGSLQELVEPEFGISYREDSLEHAMRDIKKRKLDLMGQAAFEAARKYDWGSVAKKYKEIYAGTHPS